MQYPDALNYTGTRFTLATLSTANQSTSVLADRGLIYAMKKNLFKYGEKSLSIEGSVYNDGKLL